MDELLIVREKLILQYKRYETAINFILKFALGLMTFMIINGIGHYREEFEPLFQAPFNFPYLMLITLLFTIFPPTLANLLIGLEVVLQISESTEIAFFVFLFFILVTVFYTRLAQKRSYLILAVILGFHFNLQYAVVLFAGLYGGLFSIIPVAIGVFIWSFIPETVGMLGNAAPLAAMLEEMDVMGMLTGFLDTYKALFEMVTGNFEWIFTAFVFAMMIVAVYAVSRLAIDYAKDIAVGVGALAGVLGFMIGNMITDVDFSILAGLFFMILSGLIVEIIKFFDSVLNYKKAERVQFEDEENYYYVKMVPKMIMDPAAMAADRFATAPVVRKKPAAPPVSERKMPPKKAPLPDLPQQALPPAPRRKISDDVLSEPRRDLDDPIVYTKKKPTQTTEPLSKLSFTTDFDMPSFIKEKTAKDEE